jgi:NaMN:DMB phosphoribosyltransferase
VVREGVGARGEMTQALYAHMNNKIIINKIKKKRSKMCKYKFSGNI